jgi:hypothetical protein
VSSQRAAVITINNDSRFTLARNSCNLNGSWAVLPPEEIAPESSITFAAFSTSMFFAWNDSFLFYFSFSYFFFLAVRNFNFSLYLAVHLCKLSWSVGNLFFLYCFVSRAGLLLPLDGRVIYNFSGLKDQSISFFLFNPVIGYVVIHFEPFVI